MLKNLTRCSGNKWTLNSYSSFQCRQNLRKTCIELSSEKECERSTLHLFCMPFNDPPLLWAPLQFGMKFPKFKFSYVFIDLLTSIESDHQITFFRKQNYSSFYTVVLWNWRIISSVLTHTHFAGHDHLVSFLSLKSVILTRVEFAYPRRRRDMQLTHVKMVLL